MKLYIFRTVALSITNSFPLYAQQIYMSYRFADSLQAGSELNEFHPDSVIHIQVYITQINVRIYCSLPSVFVTTELLQYAYTVYLNTSLYTLQFKNETNSVTA